MEKLLALFLTVILLSSCGSGSGSGSGDDGGEIVTITPSNVVSFSDGIGISSVSSFTESVVSGDLDGDLDLDLVIGPNFGTPRYFLNNGTNNPFAEPDVDLLLDGSRVSNAITLGDINGDGSLDIIAASFDGINHIYFNNGTMTPFESVIPVDITVDSHSTTSIHAVDIDGDFDLDVLVSNSNQQANRIYINNGTENPFDGVEGIDLSNDLFYSEDMAFGDVDNDGDTDIIVGNSGLIANHVSLQLFLNNGTASPFDGVTGIAVWSDHSVVSLALGDVDDDGSLDIVVGTGDSDDQAYLFLNNGSEIPFSGDSKITVRKPMQGWNSDIHLLDMNGDLLMDLILMTSSGSSSDQYQVYLNNGTANPFRDRLGINLGPNKAYSGWEFAVGDFDGDSDKDVVIEDSLYLATIGPDMVPPVIEVIVPVQNQTLFGEVKIKALAADSDEVESVSFQINDQLLGQDFTSPFEMDFDTTLMPNGLHSISVIAEDISKNKSAESVTITIANAL